MLFFRQSLARIFCTKSLTTQFSHRGYVSLPSLSAPIVDKTGTRFRTCAPSTFRLREFYSVNLQNISDFQTVEHPIGSTKHHIISKRQLTKLWNVLVQNTDYFQSMRSLFFELLRNQQLVDNQSKTHLNAFVSCDLKEIQRMTASQCNDAFITFLWNPGNIFMGPGSGSYGAIRYNRIDDPGPEFDETAKWILYENGESTQKVFDKLRQTNINIDRFIEYHERSVLLSIIDALEEAATHQMTPFHSDQWQCRHPRRQHRRQKSEKFKYAVKNMNLMG